MKATGTAKGNYILQLILEKGKEIAVGKSKNQFFESGYYLYIGSAFGGGGVKSRLDRHLRSEKKLHWHIDYLLLETKIVSAWFILLDYSIEHKIAAEFIATKNFKVGMNRFGSGDCNCVSHLFFSKKKMSLQTVNKVLSECGEDKSRFHDYV